MKILNLRFQNINSLKGKNEINFMASPLKDTGIFAITGATGSGKSTLLDIITLALFNKTPRFNDLSKKNIEYFGAIITRNTNECYAEIEYEVKGKQYRSKWSISKSRTGSMREYEMELAELPQNELFDLKKSAIPNKNAEIIGLNYEQFVKSILLSQGEFSKFLKADANERGELLEKITGTEIYRQIGIAAFNRQRFEKQQLELLEAQMSQIKYLAEDELDLITIEINQLKSNSLVINEEIDKLSQQLQNYLVLNTNKLELKTIENELFNLEIKKNNFQPELNCLQKHEKLVNFKPSILEIKNFNTTILELEKKVKASETLRIETDLKISKNQVDIQNLLPLSQAKQTEYELLKPILKQVIELDNQFKIQKTYLSENRQKLTALTQIIVEKQSDFELKSKQNLELEATIESKKSWLATNLILNELQSDLKLIENQVNEFDAQIKNFNKLIQNQDLNILKIGSLKNKSWKDIVDVITQSIQNQNIDIDNLYRTTSYVLADLQALSQNKETLLNQYNTAKELLVFSENYQNFLLEIELKKKKIHSFSIDLENYTLEIPKLEAEIEILTKYLEELTKRYERQLLEAKYDQDRKKLKPNEACLLCGSLHHPYIEHYTNNTNETKTEREKTQQKLNALSKQLLNSSTKLAQLQTSYAGENASLSKLNDAKAQIQQKFTDLVLQQKWSFLIDQTTVIEEFRQETLIKGKELKQHIENLNLVQKYKNQVQNMLQLSEKAININKIDQELEVFSHKYKKYFSDKLDIKSFEVLKLKQNEYLKESSNLQILIQNNLQLNSIISNIYKDLEGEREKMILFEKEVELQKSILQNISDLRFSLLQAKSTEEVEKQAVSEINQIKANLNLLENNQVKLSTEKINIQIRFDEFVNEISRNSTFLQTKMDLLMPKILALGYSKIEQVENDILAESKVEEIQAKSKEMELLLAESNSKKREKQAQIDKLEPFFDVNISAEDIQNQLNERNEIRNEHNQKIGALNQTIDTDLSKKTETQSLQVSFGQQKKEFERWDALNKLIGDASGKTFSKFAQELTLRQLLGLANKHLRKFEKRYRIVMTLDKPLDDIFVEDTFQGYAKRSVRTLSGGESFLVSLALAIGLSDLAGQNTQIESIFIDEGFGSLDQNTLDMALAALENLQAETNRTIGIISHVDILKERIRTQIDIKKSNLGFSTIEIKVS